MSRQITYAQAISEATVLAMKKDPNVLVMGLGVDDVKGIFGTTLEARKKFGLNRVIGTPASENAMTGVAIGAALNGKRPIFVHARNDFMFLALDQIINNAAKWKYVYGNDSVVPIVVRGIIGKGWGQGPTHSQSIQSVMTHFPGIYVAMPSTPYIAKGILMKSLESKVPVIIFEHRRLYDFKQYVPEKRYTVDFGKAKIFKRGKDVTVVATSILVHQALKAAKIVSDFGISVEVVDPVTISPLDEKTIIASVKKTGRLICADTSWLRCGVASEISAVVAEKAFSFLKAPIKRIALPECPCPVSRQLEEFFYKDYQDIVCACFEIVGKKRPNNLFKEKEEDLFLGPY
ncbi:MAG: transketolase C-terminal domain-containing protein [Candidatus Omnitrophica bacterium]|nr:transketolase C-terminal domain-containing protein [Candidatus Omnitrophota bacterium]